MTTAGEISPVWRSALSAVGLQHAGELLELGRAQCNAGDPQPTLRLRGEWTALRKAGLGGRQRWRWRLPETHGRPGLLFLKIYENTPVRSQLDRLRRQDSRHSRAWWEFHIAQTLAAAHIPTAEPVAYAEEMSGRRERRSAVLLAAVPGEAFDRLWRRMDSEGAGLTRGPARHDLAVRLARFVTAFHSTGLCHRDLYLCHIFADLDERALRPPAFYLIDLARVHRPRLRRLRWLIKDLAQLDSSARLIGASRSDRLRFLLAYLGLQRLSIRARWYARRIMRKSNRILARDRRKALPA